MSLAKRNKMQKALLTGLIVIIAACAGDEIEPDKSPQSAAEAFLSLIDQGKYQDSWKEASSWLRNNVNADQWAEHAGSYREPLGAIDHREFKSVEFQDTLDDMPDADYAFVFFETSLSDNGDVSEMVGLVLDTDSNWRVIGYQTH